MELPCLFYCWMNKQSREESTRKRHCVDIVDLQPSSKIGFISVKEFSHLFSYVGRDILKSSMVHPMFRRISSQRKYVLDVVLIHELTQLQQYTQAGLGKDRVCRSEGNVKSRYACT